MRKHRSLLTASLACGMVLGMLAGTSPAQDVETTVSAPALQLAAPEMSRGADTVTVEEFLASPPSLPLPAELKALSVSDADTTLPPDLLEILPMIPVPSEMDFGAPTTAPRTSRYFDLPESPLDASERDRMSSDTVGAVRLALLPAVFRALEMNQSLKIDKLRPEVSNTSIDTALAEFDPTVRASVSAGSRQSGSLSPLGKDEVPGDREPSESVSRSADVSVGIGGRLPSGTDYDLTLSGGRSSTNRTHPFYDAAVNLNITQNLLRGAGCKVNYLRVWAAENNFVISLYQLQQVLTDLVTNVQTSYYDVYLAMRSLQISLRAHEVAREQRLRTEEFVRVGKAPPLDVLAAQAEESSRISEVINAAETLRRRQLDMLRLLNPDHFTDRWDTRLFAAHGPILPDEDVRPEERVKVARKWRPDLRQAQLDLANGELEVVRTENGLLPALDFVVNAGLSGLGDNPSDAVKRITATDFPRYNVGLQFSYPLQNRAARASHRRANFQREQAMEALVNYEQIIELEVRAAAIEIERTRKLIDSTKVTAALRNEELRAEIEKYRVGRSTQLLVNQAQRDAINAAQNQVSAEVAHMKAYINMYKVEGTTLQRCGITPILITPESGVGRIR